MIRRVLPLLALASLLCAAPLHAGVADADSLIWVSEEAAIDSLNTYWRELDDDWYVPLTLEDLEIGLTPSRLDSLTSEGDAVIARMIAGRPWRLKWRPLGRLHFNRVQGLDLGGTVTLYRPGVRQPKLRSGVSYGLSWKRLTHRHRLTLPLLTARPRDAEGYLVRPPWTWLVFQAQAERDVEWFAGDHRVERNLGAMISGKDPNHYYEASTWRTDVRITPRPSLTLSAGVGGGRHRPLGVRTDWSLFGNAGDVADNLAVAGLHRRTVHAGLLVDWRGFRLRTLHEWHRVTDSPLTSDAAWYRHTLVQARWRYRDRWGDIWVLRGNWNTVDRLAPIEWMTYLGDHGTLRGYGARELTGDRGAWASLDVRWDVDLFAALRVPLLESLGLQPITFADWGRVYRHADDPALYPGGSGWRADAGVGLSKFAGFGGGVQNLRLYAAKPVGQGMHDRRWRLVIAVEGEI